MSEEEGDRYQCDCDESAHKRGFDHESGSNDATYLPYCTRSQYTAIID